MAAFVTLATRSPRITLEAAKRHALAPVSDFLRAGGKLNLDHAEYAGTDLLLQPDAWFCLGAFEQLLRHGGKIQRTDRGFDVLLGGGRVFELPSELLLPSAIVVLYERFVVDEYEGLDVAGAVVIDVGAHIGDSAVYFADRGALHVYAFEPFSQTYGTALAVIKRNRLESRVSVIRQGVARRDGQGAGVYSPIRSHAGRGSLLGCTHQPQGRSGSAEAEEFDLVSLPTVLNMVRGRHPGRPVVIKMDCEGCEVDAFQADGIVEALEMVDAILVEVHDRAVPDARWSKLEESGFSISVTHEKGGVALLFAARGETGGRSWFHNQV